MPRQQLPAQELRACAERCRLMATQSDRDPQITASFARLAEHFDELAGRREVEADLVVMVRGPLMVAVCSRVWRRMQVWVGGLPQQAGAAREAAG